MRDTATTSIVASDSRGVAPISDGYWSQNPRTSTTDIVSRIDIKRGTRKGNITIVAIGVGKDGVNAIAGDRSNAVSCPSSINGPICLTDDDRL